MTSFGPAHLSVLQCAILHTVLQRVAVCCSISQCVAVCYSVVQCVLQCVLRCVAMCYSLTLCCSLLQFVVVRCCALQCVTVCGSVLQCVAECKILITYIYVYICSNTYAFDIFSVNDDIFMDIHLCNQAIFKPYIIVYNFLFVHIAP